jgi:lipoic acid synthetase
MATRKILTIARSQPVTLQRFLGSRFGSVAASTPSSSDKLTLEDFLPGANEPPVIKASAQPLKAPVVRKPKWLKMYNPNLTEEGAARYKMVRSKIKETGLATVCQEARCPNVGECWSGGTATIMIMGDTCTRGCRFCSVATSRAPPALDPEEPEKVMDAVRKWDLDYIVLTMVDRDDLADQGSGHVAATVRRLKSSGDLRVETLCGDFQGKTELVKQVLDSGMDVFAHNIETVERLQRAVRDRRASYQQTLAVLKAAKEYRPDVVTKSSIMVGLGETTEEVHQTMADLRDVGVEIVTLGQYLQPTKRHMKVSRFVTPEEFEEFRLAGEALGLHVASGPLVRSSYRAGDFFKERLARREAAEGGGPIELQFPQMQGAPTQPSASAL